MMNYLIKRTRKKSLKFLMTSIIACIFLVCFGIYNYAQAAFNPQLNYQGKLTDSVGSTVPNGTYNMEFTLYTVSSGGSPIWTETRTGGDKVTVTNGLFSVMLGSVTSIASVDFNQSLYLGINIGGTSTPGWDGEMTPRKTFGAVPAAFVAKTLEGFTKDDFFKTSTTTSTTTATTFMSVKQLGVGAVAEFLGNSSDSILGIYTGNGGRVGVGSSSPTARLSVVGTSSSPTADIFVVASSSNANLFVVGANGNVGIGTSTPSDTLSVAGSLNLTGAFKANGDAGSIGMVLQTTGSGVQWVATSSLGIAASLSGGTNGYITRWLSASTIGTGLLLDNGTVAGVNATSTTYTFNVQGSSNVNPFNVASSTGTSLFTVLKSGNVGVGASAPASKLAVGGNGNSGFDFWVEGQANYNGGAAVSGFFPYQSFDSWNAYGAIDDATDDKLAIGGFRSSQWQGIGLYTNNAQRLFINSTGDIGIGTTTPSAKLTVTGTAGTGDVFAVASSTNTNMFVIKNTGNVGIGTTTPSATLAITGTAGTTDAFAVASSTDTNMFVIKNTGRVGIGTSTPSYPLHVVGTGYVTSILGVGGVPSGSYNFEVTGSSNFSSTAYFRGQQLNYNGAGSYLGLQSTASLNKIYTSSGSPNKDIVIQNGDVTNTTFAFGGNVGIGSTTPNAKLSITGSSTFATADLLVVASSSNSAILVVAANGKVGIGTSTPSDTLSVAGSFDLTGAFKANGDAGSTGMVLQTTGSGVQWVATSSLGIAASLSGGTNGYITRWLSASTIGTGLLLDNGTVAGVNATTSTSTFNIRGTSGINPFSVASSTGSSLFVIDQSGNVGIGTTTPQAALDVTGQSIFRSNTGPIAGIYGAGIYNRLFGGWQWDVINSRDSLVTYGVTDLAFNAGGISNTRMVIRGDSGNVGIGSTSPNARLAVTGSSTAPAGDLFIVASSSNAQLFTIKSTGLIGIGTTTPSATLAITGTAGTTDAFAVASSTDTNMFVIKNTGRVGIGTSAPSYPLHVVGTGYVTSILGVGGVPSGSYNFEVTGSSWFSSTVYFRNVAYYYNGTNTYFGMQSVGTTNKIFTTAASTNKDILIQNGDVTNTTFAFGGNVGIGSTTPNAKLSITGSSTFATADLLVVASSSNSAILVVAANGKVGIGTSTPSDTLSVAGSLNLTGALKANGDAGSTGMVLQTTGSGVQWVATSTLGASASLSGGIDGYLTRWTSSSAISTGLLLDNGTVAGVNATSTSYTFNVQGSSGVNPFNVASSTGTSLVMVDQQGDVGIGTTTPGEKLVVVGTTTTDHLIVGGGIPLTNSIAHFGTDVNSYGQVNIQNRSTGGSASGDLVVTADNGSDTTYYVDLGINSSGYNDANYSMMGANDSYLYSQSSSLAIGTASSSASSSLKFFTGGTLAANERMRISSTGNVGIGNTSPSEKLSVGGNILIGARADSAGAWTKRSNTTAGTITSGGTASIGTTSAMAVFNGSMYIGTSKINGAEIYRYDGSTWTQISSTTAGYIGTTTVGNIDSISSMAVWNGNLYVGTAETGAAEIYRYDGNSNWTRISSSSGAIGGNSTTTAIDSISAMTVHGGRLYIGTTKANSAEIDRYNGPGLPMRQTWTKVNALVGIAGTIGATTLVDSVTTLVSFQGFMYAGTSEAGSSGALYRYDGQTTAGTGFTLMGTAGTFTGTTLDGSVTAITAVGSIRTTAVYNGRLYVGVDDGAGTARVVKWDGTISAAASIYELVSSTTAGVIAEDSGSQTGIDRIGAMSIYNDDLYVGTIDSTGIGEVYKLDSGDTWTKYSSTTAGTIATGGTGSITGIFSMGVYNDDLWLGTEKASAAEVYSFNMTEGQSYNLTFEASSDNADGIQNGSTNKAFIQYQAEETAYNNTGNMNTGKFVFSHGLNTVTGAYDLAEDYPTHDDMLAPGDLVSLDISEKGFVRKASGKNDKDIIGIYSINPALRLSQQGPLIDGARAVPVALAGRVPVTVTLENGPIKIGDYLTSSQEPGKAAKATKPGRVIGRALGDYSGLDGEEPSVTVFIGVESINWNDIQSSDEDVASIVETDANTNATSTNVVAEFVDTVNTAVEDIVFAILNKADNMSIIITNKFTAVVASIQDLFVKTFTILPGGSINLPVGVNQVAGVGVLSLGATEVFIENEQIDNDTMIYVTPTSVVESPLYVDARIVGKGFYVKTKKPQDSLVTFDWFFVKTYHPKGVEDNTEVTTTVEGDSTSASTTVTVIAPDSENVTSTGDANVDTTTTDVVSSGGSGSTVTSEGEVSSSSTGGSGTAGDTTPAPVPEPTPVPTPEPETVPVTEPVVSTTEPTPEPVAPTPAPAPEPAPAPAPTE